MSISRDSIEQWSRSLRISQRRRRAISRELQSHLLEAQQDLERAGWNVEDAQRESLLRLGDPSEIVDGFRQVYRPSRRKQLGLAFALATGMLLSAYGIGGSLASAKPTTSHMGTHATGRSDARLHGIVVQTGRSDHQASR